MMQHKENVLPQPASPAAFCHTFLFATQKENKENKKIKRNSKNLKIQHTNIRTKKRSQKKSQKGAEPEWKGEAEK